MSDMRKLLLLSGIEPSDKNLLAYEKELESTLKFIEEIRKKETKEYKTPFFFPWLSGSLNHSSEEDIIRSYNKKETENFLEDLPIHENNMIKLPGV